MVADEPVGQGMATDQLIDMVLGLVPDAAVVVDEQGVIVAVNERVGQLFGYAGDELIGAPLETLVPERFRSRHRGQRASYLAHPRVRPMGVGLDLRGRRHDGSEFPVDISLAPIRTLERNLAVAAVRDISERRATEAAHAQLAAIVRTSQDAILAITVDGRVTSWNAGAEHTFGHPGAEIVGTHVSRLVPADSSPVFEDLLERAQQGEPGPPTDTEWLTHAGDRLPLAVSVSALTDATGALTGFSLMARDITGRKRAEAELRRLLAVTERQARWQEAASEIRLAVLDNAPLPQVLQLIAQRTLELMEASAVALVRGNGEVVIAAGSAAKLVGQLVEPPGTGPDTDWASGYRLEEPEPSWDGAFSGPVLVFPVWSSADALMGALYSDAPAGSEALADEDTAVMTSMAQQASMAIELERARADQDRLLLADERNRIARDLHDNAVQTLFATGLNLQGVAGMVEDPRAIERLHESIDALDDTIKQIRTAIFTLSAPVEPKAGLRATIVRLAAEAARGLGFDPAVVFDGPIDVGVPPDVAGQVSAVVREALSNIARHAHATSASVEVRVTPARCEVRVIDDGVGFAASGVGNGLANMRSRADDLGGALDVHSEPGRGTTLVWHVPLA